MSQAYELLTEEMIEDVHAKGSLLRHKKTGARVALLANNDENKVFNIAFRTPPENSTGVAHIIEHTVLCGSRKFPLKDPFVELAKGSLNTFLNAMTYPDKTMFPVASCNDKDFANLMEVYLDAVFYPNIYQNEMIFRQEGWHYHLADAKDALTYNGVVYNEMKGAFSSADEVLDRTVFSILFPDTPYGVESGGDPEVIPELTYEEFLAFHKKYYHPSNSYIYLYGNMDMEKTLDWIDQEYLSRFEKISVDSEIPLQMPFAQTKDIEAFYPVLDDEPLEKNTYLSRSFVVGNAKDALKNAAFQVLEYAILNAPGAPVKQALLDAEIGKDVYGAFDDGIRQPFFSIVSKGADADQAEAFQKIITDILTDLAEHGLNRKALLAGINAQEFRFREADFASYPRGLIYGLNMFDSWLYDDTDPFLYLKGLSVFEQMKEKVDQGYFERLITDELLNNPHGAMVTLSPRRGLAAEREQKTADVLAAYKASLSDAEIEHLVAETKALQEYQEEEDSKEALESVPMLKRSEIDQETHYQIRNEEMYFGDTKLLYHDFFTNGIGYLDLLFDTAEVPDDLLPYIGLLKAALGSLGTEHYSYNELSHEITGNTGGIAFGAQMFPNQNLGGGSFRVMGIRAKYLYPKRGFVFDMIREILLTSDFDDQKRLKEIISGQKAGLQSSLQAAGHSSAVERVMSTLLPGTSWLDRVAGISYYRFIEGLEQDFEEKKDEICSKLKELMRMVFRPENLVISLTADREELDGYAENIEALKEVLYTDSVRTGSFVWEKTIRKEAFKTSGQVQYVAIGGNYGKKDYEYTGIMRVLHTMLNYEYLWMRIRVLGGAYGCMSTFRRSGNMALVSYRDPHLKNTLDIYEALPDFLESFEADERAMTRYVIGTISEMDTPMNPCAKGSLSLNAYYTEVNMELLQRERDQVLAATAADIRATAEDVRSALSGASITVIGSEAAVEKYADLFDSVEAFVQA